MPFEKTPPAARLGGTGFAIARTDERWELIADLFDPPARRGVPAQSPRRQIVEAMLVIARTVCQ